MDNNRNMPGQENDKRDEQEYSLYTEKIVRRPGNRIKRAVKNVAKVIGSGVIFGVVAGLVMSVVYTTAKNFMEEEETTTRPSTVIPTDSQTEETEYDTWSVAESDTDESKSSTGSATESTGTETESVSGEYESGSENASGSEGESESELIMRRDELVVLVDDQIDIALSGYRPGMVQYDSLYVGLKAVIADVNQSIVSIEVSHFGITTWDDISEAGVRGFIAAEDDENFYIVTTKQLVEGKQLSVVFNDGTAAEGLYLTGDATTNLAVVAAPKNIYENGVPETVKAAVLGNSYVVQQGDPLIAIGNIYGQGDMAVYTVVTSTKGSMIDTDSSYRLISTDIAAGEEDCGVVVNTKGEIIGVIPYQNEGMTGEIINTYGISELKRLIERLINGKVTPYVGIRPQTVTAIMRDTYGMPDGIYVSSVEADSPAFYAGIQSGDVITAVGTENVATTRSFQNIIYALEPESSVTMFISRPGKDVYRNIEITLELGVE